MTFDQVRNTDRKVARGITIHDGKVLLFHRLNRGYEYYVFPGGGIDPGETPEQTAVRETLEEASCEVKAVKVLYVNEHDTDASQTFVLCKYVSGVPAVGKGTEEEKNMHNKSLGQFYETHWYDLQELPKLRLYPIEVYEFLEEDIKNDFKDCPRKIFTKMADLKSWP